MGLTIAFDRTAGEQAGLIVTFVKNGTQKEILEARDKGECPDYINWLSESSPMVSIPGIDLQCMDVGGKTNFAINAKKRGPVYAPLIAFLKHKGIEWVEI